MLFIRAAKTITARLDANGRGRGGDRLSGRWIDRSGAPTADTVARVAPHTFTRARPRLIVDGA